MLQHVSLEVAPDLVERCAAFWELLGFARVDPPAALRDRATWLERDGTQVHLMLVDEPVVPPQGHAAVVAPDYAAAIAGLRDAGFDPEARTEHWGAPRSFVRDPAGHRVEVMAAPPPRSR
jgi:catechol 2,3-dioxygenase-like lactoylglutathione lyase family enzyme